MHSVPSYDFAVPASHLDRDHIARLRAHLIEYRRDFVLSPKMWKRWNTIPHLEWKEVEFNASASSALPRERGLYCFIVRPKLQSAGPQLGFPMYVGETGDTSKSHLRKRFGDYLQEKTKMKRTKFAVMFDQLDGCIYFAYAEVSDRSVSLRALETRLSDALQAPLSSDDYSAELRAARAAF
jgi:hypothetical protein